MKQQKIKALALSRGDVEQAVTIAEIVDVVEEANRIWVLGEAVGDYHHTLFDNVEPGKVPNPHANFQSFSAYLKADFDIHGIASCGFWHAAILTRCRADFPGCARWPGSRYRGVR